MALYRLLPSQRPHSSPNDYTTHVAYSRSQHDQQRCTQHSHLRLEPDVASRGPQGTMTPPLTSLFYCVCLLATKCRHTRIWGCFLCSGICTTCQFFYAPRDDPRNYIRGDHPAWWLLMHVPYGADDTHFCARWATHILAIAHAVVTCVRRSSSLSYSADLNRQSVACTRARRFRRYWATSVRTTPRYTSTVISAGRCGSYHTFNVRPG